MFVLIDARPSHRYGRSRYAILNTRETRSNRASRLTERQGMSVWGQNPKKACRPGSIAQQADTRSSLVERRQWGIKSGSRRLG